MRACVEADIARELETTSRSGRASKCACWQPMKRSRVANAPNNRGGQYAHIARDIKKAHPSPHAETCHEIYWFCFERLLPLVVVIEGGQKQFSQWPAEAQ